MGTTRTGVTSMKTIQTLTATAIAAALSLPLAGAALADNTPAIDDTSAVMLAANTVDNATDAASDTWITTKVKSTLLAEDATPGMVSKWKPRTASFRCPVQWQPRQK